MLQDVFKQMLVDSIKRYDSDILNALWDAYVHRAECVNERNEIIDLSLCLARQYTKITNYTALQRLLISILLSEPPRRKDIYAELPEFFEDAELLAKVVLSGVDVQAEYLEEYISRLEVMDDTVFTVHYQNAIKLIENGFGGEKLVSVVLKSKHLFIKDAKKIFDLSRFSESDMVLLKDKVTSLLNIEIHVGSIETFVYMFPELNDDATENISNFILNVGPAINDSQKRLISAISANITQERKRKILEKVFSNKALSLDALNVSCEILWRDLDVLLDGNIFQMALISNEDADLRDPKRHEQEDGMSHKEHFLHKCCERLFSKLVPETGVFQSDAPTVQISDQYIVTLNYMVFELLKIKTVRHDLLWKMLRSKLAKFINDASMKLLTQNIISNFVYKSNEEYFLKKTATNRVK